MKKQSVWLVIAALSGCTLGSQYHDKNYLVKECFIDLNSAPSPDPNQGCRNQADKIYASDLEWLQNEHHTLEQDTQPALQQSP